jgi:hypothetical protein
MADHLSRTWRRALLGLSLAAWTLTLGCPFARTQERAAPDEAAIGDLQQDIDLLEEFNRLELTKDQTRALITEVEALHAKMKEQQAERAAILTRLKPLLEAKREALLKDEGVPPAVTGGIDQQSKALQQFDQDAEKALREFAPRLQKVLTQPQVDILTWVSEARVQARTLVDFARAMSDQDFKTDAAVNAENLAEGRDNITKEQILEVFRQARTMTDAEFAKDRDKLVEQLIPATRDDTAPIDLVLIRRLEPPRLPAVLRERLAQMK